jgi:protein-S-isoprenylcysteine O-methyltransferase
MKLHTQEIAIVALWVAAEFFLIVARRSKSGATSKDRHSLAVIVLVNTLAFTLGGFAAFWLHACRLPWAKLVFGVGSFLFVLGVALRWYAVIHLGRFFTTNVAISADHDLVDSGPYRFVRHPSYTGSLLAMLGVALVLFQNWASVLIVLVPICAVMLWRIRIEEQALKEALGERYSTYAQRTKRLIPLVY